VVLLRTAVARIRSCPDAQRSLLPRFLVDLGEYSGASVLDVLDRYEGYPAAYAASCRRKLQRFDLATEGQD